MVKCTICGKFNEYHNGYCKLCYDVKFYLKDTFKEYLKGAVADDKLVSALGNFSWIYAGYPRLWGFYNGIINIIFYFLTNPADIFITERDLDYFEFTEIDPQDILIVLYESKILKAPTTTSPPGRYEKGELTEMLVRKIRPELFLDPRDKTNRRRRKRSMQEMFGIVSIVLTYVLLKKKLKNPKGKILPRKAMSLFLTLAQIILSNYSSGSKIPNSFSRNLLDEQHSNMKLTRNTQIKFMMELLGLSYVSPGKTNVIANVDAATKTFYLNDEVKDLLEYWRERRRDRLRTRRR